MLIPQHGFALAAHFVHSVLGREDRVKKTPGEARTEREAYWVDIIRRARAYPKGVRAFCSDFDISHNNYYGWFRELRAQHPEWTTLPPNTTAASQARKRSRKKQAPIEVMERPKRRKFSAARKAKILQETDGAKHGEVAVVLRREGIYASTLREWRKQRDERLLTPRKRGPKGEPQAKRINELEKELARTKRKLDHANALLELQKKIAEILKSSNDDEDG